MYQKFQTIKTNEQKTFSRTFKIRGLKNVSLDQVYFLVNLLIFGKSYESFFLL